MIKRALITGITGQDGSYLAELLLAKGYEVHALVRRVAMEDPDRRLSRIRPVLSQLHLHAGSLESFASVFRVVEKSAPDECYHLAAQSFVGYSFEDEFSTMHVNIDGTHFLLSALRHLRPGCRFYFAASSEMFGNAPESPQNERTPFFPRSPYGISKLAGYHLVRNYRESAGMFALSGILFNHESPRRGFEFVSRKVTSTVARIVKGRGCKLVLGNLEARRDWGWAPDYVEAMWRMLQQEHPDDYVVATGETHSVRELVDLAFGLANLDWRDHVEVNEAFFRPAEIHLLQGDAGRARQQLGWQPTVGFREVIHRMLEADLQSL